MFNRRPIAVLYNGWQCALYVAAGLQNYKAAIEKRREVEKDLNEQLVSRNAPDMKAKQREYHEAEQRLKTIEQQLG